MVVRREPVLTDHSALQRVSDRTVVSAASPYRWGDVLAGAHA